MTVGGMNYQLSQSYRKAIFAMVQDADNWKNPVNKELSIKGMSKEDVVDLQLALTDSVVHFQACRPSFKLSGDSMVVESVGYYVATGEGA